MDLAERQWRWRALDAAIRRSDATAWRTGFVEALAATENRFQVPNSEPGTTY